ncbi:response regulator [Xanthomonas arboricola]|uniref:response regulator n=1 Tax=Xanthomonas arboricola TaxID=56448 RepID=UPI000F8DB52B|nr:response regulator [Xanthomonas arboricola]
MSLSNRPLILLADDDLSVREMTSLVLEDHGCEVLTAGDADTALELVHLHPSLKLIVTDVFMPGRINGYEMACELRKAGKQVPIILVSGWTELPGAVPDNATFMTKPYTIAQFYECIDKSLGVELDKLH